MNWKKSTELSPKFGCLMVMSGRSPLSPGKVETHLVSITTISLVFDAVAPHEATKITARGRVINGSRTVVITLVSIVKPSTDAAIIL